MAPFGRRGSGRRGPSRPSGRWSPARSSAGWPSSRRPCAADCRCPSTQPWRFAYCNATVRGRIWPARRRPTSSGRRWSSESDGLDNGLKVLVQEVHTAPLASVWCWYRVGSRDEGPGVTGVSHWVEHMNFKGTDQHPARPGQGHHRAVRRQLERLHLARPDHLPRDRHRPTPSTGCCSSRPSGWTAASTTRPTASRSGPSSSPSCRAARTIPSSCLDTGDHRHRVQGPSVPPSDHRLAVHDLRDDDPRRTCSATTGATTCPTTPPWWSSATSTPPTRCAGSSAPSAASRPAAGPPARDRGAAAGSRTARAPAQARARRPTGGRRSTPRASTTPTSSRCSCADAVLSGGAGLNIWSAARCRPPAQRPALPRAGGLAGWPRRSAASWLPTAEPFLYSVSATVAAGQSLAAVEDGGAGRDRSPRRRAASTAAELAKVQGPAARALRLRHATA